MYVEICLLFGANVTCLFIYFSRSSYIIFYNFRSTNELNIDLSLFKRRVHTMSVCSSVGQRLKSLINEPKRRRNYVREKDIFHSHNER